jgi:hypothetical protein
MMSNLEASDKESAAFAVAPRVALKDIEDAIACRYDLNAHDSVQNSGLPPVEALRVLSICILVMRNGFTVIGKSAPASPVNFNAEYGKKIAYEDAIRQLWPLMGFELRQRIWASEQFGGKEADPKADAEFMDKLAASGVREGAKY